jgi:ribonuclease P protein component
LKQFGLSAKERVKSRKDFEKIFSNGKSIFSSDKKIKATYLVDNIICKPGILISVAVYKKAGKAVWRNRIKRLIKEAYRLNKEILKTSVIRKKFLMLVVFSPNTLNEDKNKKIYLQDIEPGVKEILLKLKDKL